MSCFTCLWSFVLLLFTFSHTGRNYFCVEAIANAVWFFNSHLDIFVPFSCGLFSCIFMMFVFIGFWWRPLQRVNLVATVSCKDFFLPLKCIKLFVYFERLTQLVVLLFRCSCDLCGGNVTLLPRLLVLVRLLQLVILVFKECFELQGE